ncbi:hypothetical protein [Streptomyces roseolus]|uniref:hypothetical protein n=1 Tax=Streptomyces roseolus TaxID=67358 RepID=UPI001671C479|nr:hypothetical protein [Streptomyces roseolus]GGR35150.1 hypothetical protein GCM10010282_29590 [Streptomyces roseolus]
MKASPLPSARLAQSPAALYDGRWWLVGETGSVPLSDPSFVAVLDGFAEALAAADHAVAALRARSDEPVGPRAGGRR